MRHLKISQNLTNGTISFLKNWQSKLKLIMNPSSTTIDVTIEKSTLLITCLLLLNCIFLGDGVI